jgi:endoglucanase
MFVRMLVLTALLALAAAPAVRAADASSKPLSAWQQVKDMRRGVNIIGYDPLWNEPAKARFKQRHLKIIRDGGFDTVRIVLHAFRHMNEKNELPASWYATLNVYMNEALRQGLTVVLDEHDFGFCGKDAAACRPKLMAFWTQVAEHYKDAPNKVIFEILNEPSGAMDAVWNEYLVEALAIIRKTNPTRNVIIGPAFWNNISWLPKLELPKDDRHIIATVHYYLPMGFTHQGASWTPEYLNKTGVTWGSEKDRAELEANFDVVQKWSKENDRPILLGEFGAYDKGPMESRVAYTAAVARGAEKRGWAWAYWQFDSDFIVYDIDKDVWNEPIRRALIPKE